jgi:hypothetical protein
MPQTIAVQKGSATLSLTVNGTGASTTTIFTQSSGTATRVITNSLQIYKDVGTNTLRGTFLLTNGTTGIASPIGYIATANNFFSMAIFPSDRIASTPYGTGVAVFSGFYISQETNNANFGGSNPNVTNSYVFSDQAYGVTFPKNFWMSSGDSLSFRGFANASITSSSLYYNFTTITES